MIAVEASFPSPTLQVLKKEQAKIARLLVQAAASPSTEGVAPRGLNIMADVPTGRAATLDAGGAPALVQLLGSASEDVHRDATWALARVALEPAGCTAILDAGGIPPLVQLLDTVGRRAPVLAIKALVRDPACRQAVLDAGGVAALERALRRADHWTIGPEAEKALKALR